MERKERFVNLYIAALAPFALGAIVWAIMGIPLSRLDTGVVTLAALTVFCSCYLRIQLPRAKIHLTISDGLIIILMLKYGGEVAVAIAVIETGIASLNIRRQGVPIKTKTIFIN